MVKRNLGMKMSAVLLAAAMLAACGGKTDSGSSTTAASTTAASTTAAAAETQAASADSGAAAETTAGAETSEKLVETDPLDLKLVDEPVTLTIGYQTNAAVGPYAESYYFQDLSEKTGVQFEFVEYADSAAVTAMFASRDYPDILLNGGTDILMQDAIEAGDVVNLDDYLPEYAPLTNQFYIDNPNIRASCVGADGHLYSLPNVLQWEVNQYTGFWFINTKWLDELGLEKPTTISEFHDVLKAFKDHAGEGSIPSNVTPFYMQIYDNMRGMSDFINCFGTYVSFSAYWAMIDENGKVMYNWVNPDIKEALEYIHSLVAEGLLSQDGFTDDVNTAQAKTALAAEDLNGSFFAYTAYGQWINETMETIGPLDAENGKTAKFKMAPPPLTRNRFTVFKNCENIELAVRLAEIMGREYFSASSISGLNGQGWDYVEDGNITDLTPEFFKRVMSAVPSRLTKEIETKYTVGSGEKLSVETISRRKNLAEYQAKDAFLPQSMLYPDFSKDPEVTTRLSELNTDIQKYLKTTYSDWLINGGIEEGWDAYIAQMDALGLQEFLDLLQQEYDRYKANIAN